MSNVNEFMDEKMLELFFADTKEMLENSMDDILELENGYDRDRLDNIMRTMHSIKGGSAMIEFSAIEIFSHKLEDYFIKLRDKEIEINVEWIDDLIEGINLLKKWITKREEIFAGKGEFSKFIQEEKDEFDALVAKTFKEKITEESIVKHFVTIDTFEKVKSNDIENSEEEGYFRLEIYFDESAPMFEVKRAIVKRSLEEKGVIKESIPEEDNIMDNSVNYYKVILKSEDTKERVLKAADTTDVYFISISENISSIHTENVKKEVTLEKDAKLETINFIYENVLQMIKDGNIKKLNTNGKKVDIYGMQILELLKKTQGTEII